MKYCIDLTAWYLNPSRICQLLDQDTLNEYLKMANSQKGPVFYATDVGNARNAIKHELERWLHSNQVPSLGELILSKGTLRSGQLFTVYQDFYGKGLSKYRNRQGPLPRDAIAELHSKSKFEDKRKLRILFSPENLMSASAWSRLSGHTRLFCFCYIETFNGEEIIARPYLIGDVHTGLEPNSPDAWNGRQYGELHIADIDQFSKFSDVLKNEKSTPNLTDMRKISEEEIKVAIAEIVHEGNIPKDWGGEKSDLFTSNLSVSGTFYTAAFLLKGPAKFSEMKMADLGKNGDQIDRLFSEPADLLILQHCHKVSTSVRNTMRAFASRMHDLRYFTIIDGYDTLRLLKAYEKCGVVVSRVFRKS